jgi:hypothetical protein
MGNWKRGGIVTTIHQWTYYRSVIWQKNPIKIGQNHYFTTSYILCEVYDKEEREGYCGRANCVW